MINSFISEHSLEYIIVPRIWELLKQRFSLVIPIYFWAAREGNSLSKKIHKEQKLKILLVFPRRPKINLNKPNRVYGKINYSIINCFRKARTFGIPTVFSFPVILSFKDIANNVLIDHFEVVHFEQKDIHFFVNKETNEISVLDNQVKALRLLNDSDIFDLVTNAKELNWENAVAKINELRRMNRYDGSSNYGRFFFWGNSYKPIYFLIFM